MISIICLAGFDRTVVEALQKASAARFTGGKGNVLIVRPLKPPLEYRRGNEAYFLRAISDAISRVPPKEDVAVGLVYVRRSGEMESFVGSFFPFSIAVPIDPFFPGAFDKHERRKAMANHIKEIEAATSGLRAKIAAVRDRLSGQNFSPLTLPVRNFKSKALTSALQMAFTELGTTTNPAEVLERTCDDILRSHPLNRVSGRRKQPFFMDDRKLKFNSPGRDKHAIARSRGHEHELMCVISGRVRLGGPIMAGFHYDCCYDRGNVDASFPNCHGEVVGSAHKEYVNIAPNDHIR